MSSGGVNDVIYQFRKPQQFQRWLYGMHRAQNALLRLVPGFLSVAVRHCGVPLALKCMESIAGISHWH